MDEQSSSGAANAGWLVLAVLGLVLLGTVAFVVGRFADELVFDYVSIACSAAAALTLMAAARSSKRMRNVEA